MFGVQRGQDKMWYTDEKAIRSAWLIPGKVQGEPEVFIGSLTGPGICLQNLLFATTNLM